MLISLTGVSKGFGAEQIIENMNAAIEEGERIALIGPNGAGKTTLLNLIVGLLEPDAGRIDRRPGLRVGYLRQNGGLSPDGTIQSEMRDAMREVFDIERRMLEAGDAMAALTDHAGEDYRALEREYQRLDAAFASRDGYNAEVRVSTVLTGLGFGSFARDTAVESMSGGERTRLMLCKLLLESPGLLILDEATNHLDFRMLAWLEEHLSAYRGAILTVSHDRYFLERVTSVTWEFEGLGVVRYPASYRGYLRLRAERVERLEKEFERHQQEVARLQDYHDRNIARATTASSAKSRLRMIEHLGEAERPPALHKPPVMRFTPRLRPVRDVLRVEGLTLTAGGEETGRKLLDGFDLLLERGERLAVIGENGAGKSTLLRALAGRMPPLRGTLEWGRNARMSYYEQDSSDLHPDKTALMELWDRFPQSSERALRTLLGGLQLTGEEAFKKVGVLSGGERARLKLAMLMLEEGNVLLLDEPTNHLDIPAREALEDALLRFEGTLVVVSHDRWLLSRLPTRILRMAGGAAESFAGGFDAMQDELAARAAAVHLPAKPPPRDGEGKSDGHRGRAQRSAEAEHKRRTADLERDIARAEAELTGLEERMADPEVAGDYQALSDLAERMRELGQELDGLYAQWDRLL